jgi:hypothetical protein
VYIIKIKIRNIGIHAKVLLLFYLVALIIFNYNIVKAEQTTINSIKPLSSSQIDNFVKQREITPITIKVINNFTIILYEKNNTIGTYALTSDQQGNLKSEANHGGGNRSNPISLGLSGGSEINYGEYNFLWLTINDDQLFNKADSVRVIFKNKTEKTESIDRNKGIIIPNFSDKLGLQHIYILDKENNTLYEKAFD